MYKTRAEDKVFWHTIISPLEEVLYVQQEANYSFLYLTNGEEARVYGGMDEFLSSHPEFIRVHNSYALNPFQLRAYSLDWDKAKLHLLFKDNTRLSIGRSARWQDEFVARMNALFTPKHDGNRI